MVRARPTISGVLSACPAGALVPSTVRTGSQRAFATGPPRRRGNCGRPRRPADAIECRCSPEGHLDATLGHNRIPVLLGTAGHHHLLARPQRVVDPADRRAPDLFRDLIEPVQDRQDQP